MKFNKDVVFIPVFWSEGEGKIWFSDEEEKLAKKYFGDRARRFTMYHSFVAVNLYGSIVDKVPAPMLLELGATWKELLKLPHYEYKTSKPKELVEIEELDEIETL